MTGLLIQEFKTLIKSPASISILVIPLVLLIGLGYLLPSGWIVPSSITIGIVAAVLLYFGGSIEEIKRTSFMKSISLTRLSKFTFLATKIVFAMIVSMISVLWVLLFSWVFTATPIAFLATDFSNLLGNVDGVLGVVSQVPFDIHWDMVQWAKMLYAGIVTIVVAVSLSFIFVAFAKSSLSFYLMSFGYLLAMILFGGVVMPGFLISSDNSWFKNLYYVVPNFYTNNIMANAFSGGILNSVITPLTGKLDALVDNGIYSAIVNSGQSTELMNAFFNGAKNDATSITLNGVEVNSAILDSFNAWTGWDGTMAQLDQFISFLNSNLHNGDLLIITNESSKAIGKFTWEININNDFFIYLDKTKEIISEYIDDPTKLPLAEQLATSSISINKWFELIGLDIKLPGIGAFNFIGTLNTALGAASKPVHNLTDTLRNMFGQLDWWNWPVPWLEGTLFLLISIKFFKWS